MKGETVLHKNNTLFLKFLQEFGLDPQSYCLARGIAMTTYYRITKNETIVKPQEIEILREAARNPRFRQRLGLLNREEITSGKVEKAIEL